MFETIISMMIGEKCTIKVRMKFNDVVWTLRTKKMITSFDEEYTEKLFARGCFFKKGVKKKVKLSGAAALVIFRLITSNKHTITWQTKINQVIPCEQNTVSNT